MNRRELLTGFAAVVAIIPTMSPSDGRSSSTTCSSMRTIWIMAPQPLATWMHSWETSSGQNAIGVTRKRPGFSRR